MFRFIIVEDEPENAIYLKDAIVNYFRRKKMEVPVMRIISGLVPALCEIEEKGADLLFLDLYLEGEDGYEILRKFRALGSSTVIVSGRVERAVEAFRYGVIDFIPQPYGVERVAEALDRFYSRDSGVSSETLLVRGDEGVVLLKLADIFYINKEQKRCRVFSTRGQYLVNKTLSELISFVSSDFILVHRSRMVNLRHAIAIHSFGKGRYELELAGKMRVPVSRGLFSSLKKKLQSREPFRP